MLRTDRGKPLDNTPTIAIVDDDASVSTAVGSLIRSLGYHARLFASAESFLESTLVDDICCLVLDVQMPRMNGLELQAHLNSRGWVLPVIFITGFAEDSVRSQALQNGAVCILDKPFKSSSLIDCIESVVGRCMNIAAIA